ncbi:MAG: hypothetical protein LBH64_01360 [Coriobacteriales bacterium]|jgi:hypothetical protein|nr:hypothetical protein [Coriobacteriales bacterium]
MTLFLETLVEFRWLVVIALPVGLIAMPIMLSMADKLTWQQRSLRLFGVFYNLKNHEALWLASGLVRLLFVISVVAFATRMTPALTAFYTVLTLVSVLVCFNLRRLPLDIVNAAIVYVSLLVGNILLGYNHEVNGDPRYVVVYVLLALFVTLYTAHHYLKSVGDMLQTKADRVTPNSQSRLVILEDGDFDAR